VTESSGAPFAYAGLTEPKPDGTWEWRIAYVHSLLEKRQTDLPI